MQKYIKDFIYIVIIILLLVLVRGWLKDKIITSLGGFTHKEVETKVDSIYKITHIDTVALFNHYVESKGIILNPKPKIIRDVVYLNPVTNKEEIVDSVKVFNVAIKDSLIEGEFTVFNNLKGDLIKSPFKYKPLFPKYIKQTDTVVITKTITNTLSNKRALIGFGAGYNNHQFLSLLGSYTTKNKWQFIYEYGKSIEDTKAIINNQPFEFKPKDLHSLKIIKNF